MSAPTRGDDAMADESRAWFEAAHAAHHRELLAHGYRLTGNVADADDLVQETFLRAWKARDTFEGRASARTWLYRIATNLFLDTRKAASRRTTPAGDAFEWNTALGPFPDTLLDAGPHTAHAAAETVELALIAALTHLPPRQRAAFVLRDVHGWTPAEVADTLGVALPAANSLLQRARAAVRRHAPADPRDWRRPALTSADEDLLRRYAEARSPADFRALLAEDVRITMPPEPAIVGVDAAADFLGRPLDWRTFPASANGRPALLCYLREPGATHYEALAVDVLRIEGGRIAESNAFIGAHHVTAFGMPRLLVP
ncbi:RNA polymerase subunit sigma-70 [Phytomonospora sp. NPDC050363]|uniref:RNA polymerase subunit sigma-70 n=1 Tax=Phytomonospora sp. NPDC050363 TaxID=3155642 RepID=UPI0033C323B6